MLLRKYAIGTKGPNLRAFRRLSSEMNTMILLNEPLLTLKSVRVVATDRFPGWCGHRASLLNKGKWKVILGLLGASGL